MEAIQKFILENNQNLYFTIPLMLWSLVWKGLALYKAARKEDKIWFAIILVVNTLGILEILYYFVLSKKNPLVLSFSMEKKNSLKRK